MFSLAQLDTTETFEGCPLVRVPDAAKDLKHFLKAILDPDCYDRICSVDFGAVAGILRISAKYDCAHFRERIISQLKRAYPSSLEACDNRTEASEVFPSMNEARSFMVVQLALEVNIPVLLPASLCLCVRKPLKRILEGVEDPNGLHHELDQTTKNLCIFAQHRLASIWKKVYLAILLNRHTSTQYLNPTSCAKGVAATFLGLEPRVEGPRVYLLPSATYVDRALILLGGNDVCEECREMVREQLETTRGKLWDEWPSYFDLPDWATLLASENNN